MRAAARYGAERGPIAGLCRPWPTGQALLWLPSGMPELIDPWVFSGIGVG